MKVSLLKFIR